MPPGVSLSRLAGMVRTSPVAAGHLAQLGFKCKASSTFNVQRWTRNVWPKPKT